MQLELALQLETPTAIHHGEPRRKIGRPSKPAPAEGPPKPRVLFVNGLFIVPLKEVLEILNVTIAYTSSSFTFHRQDTNKVMSTHTRNMQCQTPFDALRQAKWYKESVFDKKAQAYYRPKYRHSGPTTKTEAA